MQTQRNTTLMSREIHKMQNQTSAPFCLSVEEKLSIMEALDHLHVSRQYQEMGACTVCKKISIKKCSACGIFYCSSECQTFDWPKHRVHCSMQRESLSDRNSFASSRKMRGVSSVKNFSEETFMMNERNSPFTALANQLNKKTGNLFSGSKSIANFKIGNRQYQNREQTLKYNEAVSNGVKENRKLNFNDRKRTSSPKKISNIKSPIEEKKEFLNNKNHSKDRTMSLESEQSKTIENVSSGSSILSRKSLPKIDKLEVIGTFRESPDRYWVMNLKNVPKYEEIQKILNEQFSTYEPTSPKIGLVCACTFADEWFRAKIMSFKPEPIVHFIDYGNSSTYDLKIFRKLPSELESLPGLAFLIEFEEGTPPQYKTADLDSLKLIIEETTRTSDGAVRVKILEGAYGPTLKLQPVRKPDKNKVRSKNEKSAIDSLTSKSNGMLFFVPGEGLTRFASIVPDNLKEANECLEKVLNIDNPNSLPLEAVEGDYVLVTDGEGNDQRGRVTSKIGSTYYVQLIDCGNVISSDKVYPMPEDLKSLIELGVKVTIEEVVIPEQVKQLETCFFYIDGEQNSGKWPCVIKGTKQQIIAKGSLEKPTEAIKWQPKYVHLKSGSTVEICSISSQNSFYVRSVDAETEQKFLDMNMEMIQFAPKAQSYLVPPSVGELCCARFEDDCCFYRAVVNSVLRAKVSVTFVDFGNEQATDLRDVKPLPDSLRDIQFFAVKVRLKNVSNKPWNNMIKDYIMKLMSENIELTMTYEEPISGGVILREKVSGLIVNEFIEKAKSKSNDTNSLKTNSLKKEEVFLDDDLKCTVVTSGMKYVLALLYVNENEFETTQMFWATIGGVDNFNYVNGELSNLISDYCATVSTPYEPSFRELCLAEFEGFWYRAACAGNEGDLFKVFFVDFGNFCELKPSSIRKMKKEFIEAPALAMNCTLKGSERLKGNPTLTKKIVGILLNRMNTLIEDVTITKLKEDIFSLEIPEIEAILSG